MSLQEMTVPCPVGTKAVALVALGAEGHFRGKRGKQGGGLPAGNGAEVSESHPDSPTLMSLHFLLKGKQE